MNHRSQYRFSTWQTGNTWACHARSDSEWFRQYGFDSKVEADAWGEDALVEMERNDLALAGASSIL